MEQSFRLDQLGCNACAQKMERRIKKMKNVDDAHINFMFSKLTVKTKASLSDTDIAEIQKIINKIEPDCKLVY